VFTVQDPNPYEWRKSDDDSGEIDGSGWPAGLTEYRDGVFYAAHVGFDYWHRRMPGAAPTFHSETTEGPFKGLTITVDENEVSVDYPFDNQIGGTTQYSLIIRRSTGRFIETFTSKNAPVTTHTGTCLVYR
jgi:hypothetical protein